MQQKRTTHSDLARIILDHREALKRVPAGYLVNDASTLRCLEDAARILCEQDERIGALTVAIRETGNREVISALLSKKPAVARAR